MKSIRKAARSRRASAALTPPRTPAQPIFEFTELERRVLLSTTTLTPSAAAYVRDGVYAATNYAGAVTAAADPSVLSVTPEDNAGNGLAAGSAGQGQRSMETQIAVVFSEPVDLASGAFSLGLVNNYGSGTNDGSADTALTGVLGTPANLNGDGITWCHGPGTCNLKIRVYQRGSDNNIIDGSQETTTLKVTVTAVKRT